MTFPPSDAIVYRNEAGEPTGWDTPAEAPYCDNCGYYHVGPCVDGTDLEDDDLDDEDDDPDCEDDEGEL